MKNFFASFAIVGTLIFLITACNKSSNLGADLFTGENANVQFTDTLSFNAISSTADSALMYTIYASAYSSLPLGKMDDPQFGQTESQIFMQFLQTSNLPNFSDNTLDHSKIKIDSAFLVYGYGGDRYYGDTSAMQKISVYRMTEDMVVTGDIYSSKSYGIDKSKVLGQLAFQPLPNTYHKIDTLNATTGLRDSIRSEVPQIKIPIDRVFALELLSYDSTTYSLPANFAQKFKGFNIRVDNPTKCMLALDVTPAATSATGLTVYYKLPNDTTAYNFTFASSSLRIANIKSAAKTSPIAALLNDTKGVNDFLYLQGLVGPSVKIEIPYLQNLKGAGKVAINKAEMIFTVVKTNDPILDSIYKPCPQLVAHKPNGALIADFADNSNISPSTLPYYYSKGYIETSDSTKDANGNFVCQYRVNLSHHLQRMLDGLEGTSINFYPDPKTVKLSRSILYGLKSKYKPKLAVTFTKL